MEIFIFIAFTLFALVWDGIFGEGSFVVTIGIGGLFFGLGQFLKWIGLSSQISFYIATGGFLIVIVYMRIDDRRFRIEMEKRQKKIWEDRVIYDKKMEERQKKRMEDRVIYDKKVEEALEKAKGEEK